MRLPLDHLGPPGCWINRRRRGGGVSFMSWIVMLPPNRLLKVTVLPYGEVRLSDEVTRVEPRDGSVSLWEGEVSGALSPSLCCALSLSCENTARRQPSVSQEESSHQNPATLTPWSQSSSPRTVRNKCLLYKPLRLWYLVTAAPALTVPWMMWLPRGKWLCYLVEERGIQGLTGGTS